MDQTIDIGRWKSMALDLAPPRIHPFVKGCYWTLFSKKSDGSRLDGLPKKLSDSHVCDAELLIDRNKLLDRLPKNATVAELGVDTGGFSKRIYSITNPEKLYLVDPWGSERYGEEKLNSVIKSFSEEVEKEEVIILRERSETALKQFDDQFFDWVYIDTTHTYNQTKLELELSEKKVKDSGIIAGHDYKIGNVDKGRRYGVIEAVHEFCEKYNWKILYLTLETGGSRSFALTKIK